MADSLIHQHQESLRPKRKARVTVPLGRNIPKVLRAQVIERANGVCELCGSIYALEIDHIMPYAKGGKTELDNLRLLCKNCNLRAGIKEFGKEKMRRG
jgi:5-methylcytosine-specific restriction endonuclease McrA